MKTNIKLGENVISQQYNSKKAVKSISLIALGILTIALTSLLIPNGSSINLMLLTIGVIVGLSGIIKLLTSDKEYIYTATKSPIKLTSIFFDANKLGTLLDSLEREEYGILAKVKKEENTGVQLDILQSKDNQLFVYQTFHYVPYQLDPTSELYQVTESQRTAFSNYILRLNK